MDQRTFCDAFSHAYLYARWQRRLGPDEVEDTVQEVFLECFKDDGILNRVSSIRNQGFRSFLYGAARHVALRVEERKARRPDRPGAETFHGVERTADETSLSKAFERALRDVVTEQQPGSAESIRRTCPELLSSLG